MSNKKSKQVFSDDEREAIKEYTKEKIGGKTDGEKLILDKIALMEGSDKIITLRIHEIVKANAPRLIPKTWYGMPAYANKDGHVVCFIQPADKFKVRYLTLGFTDKAHIDDGDMWATSFAITKMTEVNEKEIATLVRKAVS